MSSTPRSFRTVVAQIQHEPDKIRGSRHIATAAPIADEHDVSALIAAARAQLPAANHHAYAWRLGRDRERFRTSDDGEPSGSAGRPILMQIDRLELTRTAVVVSRIFGGTKLGVGGLARAYGGAAAAVLEQAEIAVRLLTDAVRVAHAYPLSGAVQGVLHEAGLEPRDAEYGAEVRFVVDVPVDQVASFLRAIADATSGRARCTVE